MSEQSKNLAGLATGLAFGYLLQRGDLSSSRAITDQFAGRDWRMVQAMGTAVAVGSAAVAALEARGVPTPAVKPLQLGGVLGGAAVFGSGMALGGYCPGTAVAGAGAGRADARWAVLGMLAGAAAFVRLYPQLKPLQTKGDLGRIRLG